MLPMQRTIEIDLEQSYFHDNIFCTLLMGNRKLFLPFLKVKLKKKSQSITQVSVGIRSPSHKKLLCSLSCT